MYKIGILDDDLIFAAELRELIYKSINNIEIHIFDTITELMIKEYNAIFIDIELNNSEENGFQIANNIKKIKNIPIIFISSHRNYALDGYGYQAFDFLFKGQLQQYLNSSLSRLISALDESNKFLILLNEDGEDEAILVSEIRYMIKRGNYIRIYAKKEYHKRIAIKKMLEKIPDFFFSPTSGSIVNINYVEKINRESLTITLMEGETLYITKENLKPCRDLFIESKLLCNYF